MKRKDDFIKHVIIKCLNSEQTTENLLKAQTDYIDVLTRRIKQLEEIKNQYSEIIEIKDNTLASTETLLNIYKTENAKYKSNKLIRIIKFFSF